MLVAAIGQQRAWDIMAVKRSGNGPDAGLEEAPPIITGTASGFALASARPAATR